MKSEIVVFLRNQNILTTTQRSVTTASATGTLTNQATITITKTNVKNIRSITVGGVSKVLGTDWNVVYGTGGTNCVITFLVNQTGAYAVSHDYGTDSIFGDYPRDDLTIDSYPRIAIDFTGIPTDAFGIGGSEFISSPIFSITIYADNIESIDTYTQSIKDAFITAAKSFYYFNFVKLNFIGPAINSPDRRSEIMQRNLDYEIMFQTN